MTLDTKLIESYPSLNPRDGCQEIGEIILILVMQSIQDWLVLSEANRELPPVPVQRVAVNVRKMQLLSAVLSISFSLVVAVDSAAMSGTVGASSLGGGGGGTRAFLVCNPTDQLPAEAAI